jgi:hypothetical protein
MYAFIGTMCFALVNGGTLCLEKAESGDFKISCITPKALAGFENVKPCEFTMTAPAVVAPVSR